MKKKTFNIDFIGNSKRYLIISLAIIALGILFTIFAGVKLDIEFVGGTMLSYV